MILSGRELLYASPPVNFKKIEIYCNTFTVILYLTYDGRRKR